MNTCEVYRMVEASVVAKRTATLGNLQLHGTQCIYTAMCITNCCVRTIVFNVYIKADIGCCVIVFVEKLEFYQQSYTQRTLESVTLFFTAEILMCLTFTHMKTK